MDFLPFCSCFMPQPPVDNDEDNYGDVWRDCEGSHGDVYNPFLGEQVRIGEEVEEASIQRMKLFLGLEEEIINQPALGLNWQPSSLKDNIEVKDSVVEGSIWQAVRAVATIKADRLQILNLILDSSRIKEYDEMFDFSKLLVTVNDRTNIRRMCYKPVWPTAPRDFLCCTTWMELEDRSLFICARSVTNKFMKTQEGYVRGSLDITGYWIQPSHQLDKSDPYYAPEGNINSCKVTLIVHTDLGGDLPTWIINMLITEAPVKILTSIGSIFEKENAKFVRQ